MNTVRENFQVWRAVTDAFAYCWQRRRLMERYGIIPLILGLGVAWTLLYFRVSPDERTVARFSGDFLAFLIAIPPAVAWYRTIVYGEEAGRRPIYAFTRLEVRMVLWQILFVFPLFIAVLVAAIPVVAAGAVGKMLGGDIGAYALATPFGIAALAWVFYVVTRLSLVIAMAALETRASFERAWKMSAPIAWRLTGAVFVMILGLIPMGLVGIGIEKLFEPHAAAPYVGAAIDAVTGLIGLFLLSTLFGQTYKTLAETETPPAEPAAL
ncbi:MAG: hypothetical protein AB7I36_08840 [Rhodospirillaceae bacterium]